MNLDDNHNGGKDELLEDLKMRNDRLAMLYSIALDLLNDREVDNVLERILVGASELLAAPWGVLDIVEEDILLINYSTELAKPLKGSRVQMNTAHLTETAIKTRQPQFVDDYLNLVDRVKLHDPYQLRAACTFPIVVGDKALGAISLGRVEPDKPFTSQEVELMYSMAYLAGLALANASLFEETRKKSITDGLTGLANRRQFDLVLEEEWLHASRSKRPLTLFMLDIDFFKKYNDSYGHTKGDDCIKKIAETLTQFARRSLDLAARYGGEEFAVILPGVKATTAIKMAESLCASIEALQIPHEYSDVSPWVTVSVGVATLLPKAGTSPIKLITLADKALYHAKQSGKNQVGRKPKDASM